MKKKVLAVFTLIMVTGGIGYETYAKMDAGSYYRERHCWGSGSFRCSGSGSDCAFETKCTG